MSIDKTIIETYKPKVVAARKTVDESSDLLDRIQNLADFYDGILNSTFKNYSINLDNQKHDLKDLIGSTDFKTFFLSVIEKRYNELVEKLKLNNKTNGK
jgi:hypothetical protein